MTYLSLCSGIEAATVAWHPLGFTPIAFSEIEPFPSAVLNHHYPHTPNLGNMLDYENWNLGTINILVGGTPCQAFSIAGKRGSLTDHRGNLCLTFCEIADKFDPEWIIWENVPGVLNTPDNAFGCLLGRLCGSHTPIPPANGRKHHNCGLVSGPKRTVAWRILDAQWFGVPQRRRRIYVLAVPGPHNWTCADALLPIGESLHRHHQTSSKTRKTTPGSPRNSPQKSHWEGAPHPTLHAIGTGIGLSNQELFSQRGSYLVPDISPTVSAKWAKGTGGPAGDETQNLIIYNRHEYANFTASKTTTQPLRINGYRDDILLFENHPQDSRITGPKEISPTVSAKWGTGGNNTPIIFHLQQDPIHSTHTSPCLSSGGTKGQASLGVCIPINIRNATRKSQNDTSGISIGSDGDPSYTLTTQGKTPGICYCIQGNIIGRQIQNGGNGTGFSENISGTLTRTDVHAIAYPGHVRRLMPIEAERLQGFPDNWTLIDKKPGIPYTDGHRYKAIGNSMAVPVMRWIGNQIKKHSTNQHP